MTLARKRASKTLLTLITFIVISAIFFRLITKPALAAWFDDSYAYRHIITFTHNAAISTERSVTFTLDTAELIAANLMQSDCDDTRFTDGSGKLLKYDLTGTCNNATTTYEIIFPSVLNGTNTAYVYYGNAAAYNAEVDSSTYTALTPSGGDPSLTNPTSSGSQEQGPSPISYWALDEGSGSTANDFSTGSNNDLSITNAAWKSEDFCISGRCLYFDGNGDYATKTYSSDTELLPSTTSFTISSWFKHSSTAGADILISRTDAVNGVGWKVYMNSSGYMCFGIDQTAGTFPNDDACSSTSYADSRWHFVTAVKNGTTNIQIYIDNVLIDTQTGITASSISGTNAPFTVGNDYDNGTNGWVGFIDEVKYYNFAKSTSQIQTEFASRGAVKGTSVQFGSDINKSLSDGLVGYWKLDETSTGAGAVTRNDSSGNGNNLTDNNTTASGTGKFDHAADPETTTNEYLSITDGSQTGLDLTNEFTLSIWFKPESLSFGCTSCSGALFVKRPSSGGGTEYPYGLWISGDGGSDHFIWGNFAPNSSSGTEGLYGTTPLTTSTWYHAAFVVKNSTGTLYLNGAVQSTYNFSFSSAYNSDGNFEIGGTINDTFDGLLDDARVYNRALSSSEIQTLYNIPLGPIGHWKMDENLGTSTTIDNSGNGNNGTLSGITNSKWSTGKYGSALTFTAAGSESINAGSATAIDQLPALTAEAWVYPTSFTNNAIVYMKASGLSTNGWDFVILNSGKLEFAVDYTVGNTLTFQTTTAITLNQWNHIAVTWDGSTTVANAIPYINGIRVTQFDTQTAGGTTRIDDSSQNLILAGDGAGSNIDGKIDDFRLYNYVRTPKQIIEDMNASHPAGGSPIASQVLYWAFDEGQGTTANNSGSASSSNGTLTSIAAPATTTSGWTASGKVNKGIIFDGSNDNVLLATANDAAVDFNGSEPFTLSAWVYPTTMASTNERDAIIVKWDTTGVQRDYRLTLTNDDADTTGNFRVEVYDESADQTISASGANDTVSVNTWYHVAATFNGGATGAAGDLKLYVNGLLTNSSSANASFLGLEDQAADFTVGDYDAGDANAANTAFTGTIDEVKVYASELNATDIAIDKNANSAITLGGVLGTQDDEGFGGNSPVAYWKFDENGGSTVYDSSGYNNTSTSFSLAFWSPGKVGQAIESNNSGTGIKVTDNSSLDITDSYTISAWIYKTASLTGTCGEIVQKGNGTDSANFFLDLCDNGGNDYLGTGFYNAAWKDVYDTSTPIPNNQWTHVAGVFSNSADKFTLYVNGREIRNDPETSTLVTNNLNTAIFSDSSDNFDFTGRIDELKIYNYARTPAQIAYDFNRGAPLAVYSFDECSGDTAYNSAPAASGGARGLNGTLTYGGTGNTSSGDCTTSASSMRYNGRNGKYSAGLDFDGTNDYVDMNDQNEFDIGQSTTDLPSTFSISAWVSRDSTGTVDIIASKTDDNITGPGGYRLGINSSNLVYLYFEHPSPATYEVDSLKTITSSGWHHIVGTFDRSSVSNTNIYIDGVLDVQTRTGTLSNMTDISNSDDFRIGAMADGGGPFDGQIDEVRFYTYPLSATQVQKLYNEGAAIRFGPSTGSP